LEKGDDAENEKNTKGKSLTPSRDLVIAVYVMINMYIWGFI
jgi:hypothetical protein